MNRKKSIYLFLLICIQFMTFLFSYALASEPVIVTQIQLPDSSPGGLAVDGDRFWFVDMDTDMIIEINESGTMISSFLSPEELPKGLAFDGTHLWLSDSGDNKIYQLTTRGEIISSFETPGNYPRGIAFDGSYLWHSDSDKAKIYKFNTSGTLLDEFDAPGPSPHGLAFDGQALWVVDRELKKFFKISTSGIILRSFDSPDDSPYGLAFDGKYLWSVERSGDKLYQFNIDHDLSDTPFFLNTRWGQYNEFTRFTPDHYRCGCWSTALAQILYYYRLQPSGSVIYTTSTGYTLDENFGSYQFDWNLFVDEFNDTTSEASMNEVARYVYFTSVVIQKDFNTATYVLSTQEMEDALETHYDCDVEIYSISSYTLNELKAVIFDEIQECRPIMLYLTHPEIGHATVIDGYTTVEGKDYIHINMGGEGKNDGWYDINSTILESYEIKRILTINPLNIDTQSDAYFCINGDSEPNPPDTDDADVQNLHDSNLVFDWAEANFPEFFYPPKAETFQVEDYNVRYYSQTNTYIGTLGRNFYIYGTVFNGLIYIGSIDEYL